jgi:hypothetical protein
MNNHLHRDMCGMHHPGTLLSDIDRMVLEGCILPAVQYACCYWASHVQASDTSVIMRDYDCAYTFFLQQTLHWLECLSLVRHVSAGIQSLLKLLSVVDVRLFSVSYRDKALNV